MTVVWRGKQIEVSEVTKPWRGAIINEVSQTYGKSEDLGSTTHSLKGTTIRAYGVFERLWFIGMDCNKQFFHRLFVPV